MEQYISKTAVVAEIERRKEESWLGSYTKEKGIIFDITNDILSFIDTLEVKEADLEKEIDDYVNEHFSECDDGVLISDANSKELTLLDITPLAKYFFELGLKSQK